MVVSLIQNNSKTVLVTGGLGYVGGRLSDFLLIKGYNVVISSRSIPDSFIQSNFPEADFVLHEELLRGNIKKKIDIVIHAASLNEVDCINFPEEAIEVNINQTRIIAEWAGKNAVKHFIYFSTAHVYSSPLVGRLNEQSMTHPLHPYSITHRAAEDYVMAVSSKTEMKFSILRMSNSFGPPILPNVNRWTLLVNDLCRQIAETKKIKLNSSGKAYRDFVSLSDVCEAVEYLIRSNEFTNEVYNLGSGFSTSIIDMAVLIKDRYESLFNNKVIIEIPLIKETTRDRNFTFSVGKLAGIGFIPRNDFAKEIDATHLFCHRHFGNKDN